MCRFAAINNPLCVELPAYGSECDGPAPSQAPVIGVSSKKFLDWSESWARVHYANDCASLVAAMNGAAIFWVDDVANV